MSSDDQDEPLECRSMPYRDMESLIRDMYRTLCMVSFRCLGNNADAEDAVQSACVKAWRCWPSLAGFSTAEQQRAYLARTAINESLQIRRQPHRRREVLEAEYLEAVWTSDFPGGSDESIEERLRIAWKAIGDLPDENRGVVTMYAAGYEYREIAAMLDISVSTARSHVSLGRKRLRARDSRREVESA